MNSIEKKIEALLDEMLDYALNMPMDEDTILVKKSIAELAINYVKSKDNEEEGSFFQSFFDNQLDQFGKFELEEENEEDDKKDEYKEIHRKKTKKNKKQ